MNSFYNKLNSDFWRSFENYRSYNYKHGEVPDFNVFNAMIE